MGRTLNITLKKKWFDMIGSGEKLEEYREIKPYWAQRLTWHEFHLLTPEVISSYAEQGRDILRRDFDYIKAVNGYGNHSPHITWVHKGIRIGKPNPAWCEPEDVDKTVFILEIGEIIERKP